MDDERCPRCQWPLTELQRSGSSHPASAGRVDYRRCVCGTWLLVVNGTLTGATRGPKIG
ncbi:hypothetical protein HNR02_005372 [Amycolatopsis endophytica]|uniref:Ogr/Delta-like zinc finger protein n=1 Tax=Amycolatopsis endophytica TaxID=860233 RepID=A0A853BBD6_9PSEU|nr:hypothetical protein [Amycolatopsis endophytica]NYI91997.1 hypothetical protein [Amycolatopsis endophytica]